MSQKISKPTKRGGDKDEEKKRKAVNKKCFQAQSLLEGVEPTYAV